MAFWSEFLEACGNTENVSIICRDGVIRSHKLVLALISKLMEDILKDIPTGDEAIIYLPDTIKTDVEYLIQNAASDKTKCCTETGLLFGINVPRVGPITEDVEEKSTLMHFKEEIAEEGEPGQDQGAPYSQGNSDDLMSTIPEPQKDRKPRAKYFRHLVKDEDYFGDENGKSYDGHTNDFKKSKPMSKEEKAIINDDLFLDKQERTRKALAALKSGQISSGRKAARIFGLSPATLSLCLKQNRVIKRTGKKKKHLTDEEEKIIINRIREDSSKEELSISRLKELFWGEIISIIARCPEREEALLRLDPNVKPGFVLRFARRHKLRRANERTSFECGACDLKFWYRPLLLQHQSDVHGKSKREIVEESKISNVGEMNEESSDEEELKNDETGKDPDLSNLYELEQRVKELEEEKVQDPTTAKQRRRNEKVDLRIRCERAATAVLSGQVSNQREAGKMFNVSHGTVSLLIKSRKEGTIRGIGAGGQRKYLSQEEENYIAQRVRSLDTDPDFKSVKKIFFEEIETLKINFPERAETLDKLKGKDNKTNHVRRFIERYNLCKESDKERKKYLDENRTVECEVCHKLYTNKKYILKHMRTVHSFLFT